MGVFLGSATADVEIRAMTIAVLLLPAQDKGVQRGKLFPEYCQGLGSVPNLKNLPVGQERDIFKTVQSENYSTDDLHCAQLFLRMASSTSNKNLDYEKSNMAELCSIEFLACGRISMRHAYPFVTRAKDFQWRSVPIARGEWHFTGLGMTDLRVRFRFCKKEYLASKLKVTVRRVALLANLRIHTAAVSAVPVCSERMH
jgi:hypothetical protein